MINFTENDARLFLHTLERALDEGQIRDEEFEPLLRKIVAEYGEAILDEFCLVHFFWVRDLKNKTALSDL